MHQFVRAPGCLKTFLPVMKANVQPVITNLVRGFVRMFG